MMRSSFYGFLALAMAFSVVCPSSTTAQGEKGTITGSVTDSSHAVMPGAEVKLEPGNVSVVSDAQGEFTITGVTPGAYSLTVNYVGFSPSTTSVTVTAGQVSQVDLVMTVSSQSESIVVTAARAHGEAEAINLERTTTNILDVLPAPVITSLPNANVADAVGRLPSVTLERDEGEGKYVQIRGTEPRLSNLTIDGVEVPSPEGGVRQVKLDTIPADLVQSVQIFKTLQANQPGDAIGGSVNIETKTAGERPTISFYGSGGFTPIINTVPVSEFGGTVGKRLGAAKRLGVTVGGGFDYNGRGIDDIEPGAPTFVPGAPFNRGESNIAIREYKYDRRRYGFGGNVDYKLGSASTLFVHTLFSEFKDYGHRWEWNINPNDPTSLPGTNVPSFDPERRTADYQVASLILGGDHTLGKWIIQWKASVARSRLLGPIGGGESHTIFSYIPATSNCAYDAAANKNIYLPQFTPACFTEAYNPANFQLSQIQDSNHGLTAQVNLYGYGSAGRSYTLGSHTGLFQFGGSFRNVHKFDDSYEIDYSPIDPTKVPQTLFKTDFTNPNYYGGAYKIGPTTDWEQINAFKATHPDLFMLSPTQAVPKGGNSNNFNLIERVSAGYLMNTLEAGRFTLIAGVRFEGTQDDTLSFDLTKGTLSFKGHGSYVDVLPSVAVTFRLDSSSDIRLGYARGISRPDPAFLTTATNVDNSTTPPTVTIGNPALTPEHAHNYDVLYERYLSPLGLVRAGFFYKSLSDPIVTLLAGPLTNPPACPQPTCFVSQAGNAGSAHIAGLEFGFQQHFTYLPGTLRGLGLLANYGYSTSQAKGVNPAKRSDSPALLRQAPHTWNISPTYDQGRLSLRAGMAYNGPHIFSYAFQNGAPGGITGPGGDVYLFSHFQVDAQGSYRLGRGWTFIASALNLNNEPFGFYNGSPAFFIQREFYKPTYSFGFRWDLSRE
jgi:TonB-dependent receptor